MKHKPLLSLTTLLLLAVLISPLGAQSVAYPSASALARAPGANPGAQLGSNGTNLTVALDVGLGWKEFANPTSKVAAGFSGTSGKWTFLDLTIPDVLDYGINGGNIGLVGNDKQVWAFYPTVDNWVVRSLLEVDGYDAAGFTAVAWGDSDAAVGFSSYLNQAGTQPLTGTGYQASMEDSGLCTTALLFNSDDAYAYSALTNSWSNQALADPPEGQTAGRNVALIWDKGTQYGYSALFSNWYPHPKGTAPMSGAAGAWVALSYNPLECTIFDGQDGTWYPGPTFSQLFSPIVRMGKEVALVWSNDGAWAFDIRHDRWLDIGIVPGTQLAYQGKVFNNTMLLWNNNEAWGYVRNFFMPGHKIALDGSPVMTRVSDKGAVIVGRRAAYGMGTLCSWAPLALDPHKSYSVEMRYKTAVVWTDDEAYVFNCVTNAWEQINVANPVNIHATASNRHATIWNDTKAYAYVAESGQIYEYDLASPPLQGYGAGWVSSILDQNNKLYAFSEETLTWSEQQLSASPRFFNSQGYQVVVVTKDDMAYGFSAYLGAFTPQALDATANIMKIGWTAGVIVTGPSIYGYSAYTGTWDQRSK